MSGQALSSHLPPVAVIGAGGHAKVVISTLQAAGVSVSGLLDDDARWRGRTVLGIPVTSTVADLVDTSDTRAVIAVGDNRARQRIAGRFRHLQWVTVVHPAAWVHPSVTLGAGTVVFAGAVIQPDTAVGDHVIVNTGATVDHDCVLGNFAHLAPGVHLAGNVQVGDGALLGIGSAVLPGRSVGAWSTVGAGGVVVQDLPGGVVAVGLPARVVDRRPNHPANKGES